MIQTTKIAVDTPENIQLEFELAGLASRFLAYLMDALIQLAILLILFYALTIAAVALSSFVPEEARDFLPVAAILLIFLLYEGYFVFLETYWRGQSIGKRILGLRVVKDGGQPIRFTDAFIRNIMRFADMLPPIWFYPTYGIGCAVLMSNRLHKRIGDFAAGTIVVREKRIRGFEHVRALQIHPDMLRQIRMPFTGSLTNDDLYVVREFFYRKNTFPPDVRLKLAESIATHIRVKLRMEQPIAQPVKFLDDLMLYLENHG